jgi:hypothetical protein
MVHTCLMIAENKMSYTCEVLRPEPSTERVLINTRGDDSDC